ncbi:hypothetical protein TTHERM_00393090 (macronuclear) [Tetrahymena thermophila SB210]|uniref:Uncharacterized protein n=1 Tax=Tetrahymena thermophila (strain SB210) TaxID=312017 RepID=Q233E0_TETTS|nr:hypothetical protein TTHERM_00393090 [Tetrahymena thermophila SB210]EAR91640.3 hypothetical protein TTHERM_00393090 [Tetrahymena thermophila SB210]|eukprot:XP_001011885.3 hypothetical protein TTHERM_00393090 [Tetrahymena thermophila SB210]
MTSYYEGRDLLRTEDIYGSQSATAIKYRNIDQEQYVPVVIKNVPEVYQRQADLHKSIRNPHFNDYRYDLNQQHPQFIPNSHSSSYKDSLDNFKQEQEAIKTQILKNNSQINYDMIRMQKNKNTYDKLNPPFANLHSEINERQYQYNSLRSPLNQQLKNSQSNGFLSNNSSGNLIQYANQIQDQSPSDRQINAQQKILANRSASIPLLNKNVNLSEVINSQRIFKPEDQSPLNLYQMNQQQQIYQQQQVGSPSQVNNQVYQNNIQHQQQILNQPKNNFQDYVLNDQVSPQNHQQQIQQQQQQHQHQQQQQFMQQNIQPQQNVQIQDQMQQSDYQSPEKVVQSSTISNKKTYKPYNIIIHNRYIPYTPKFDLPEIKWDKYDRQMFKNFDQKAMPPVEIIRTKNEKMNSFPDYTTWNQKYGDAK